MDLKEENAIGGDPGSHWYYISKGRAIKALIGRERARSLIDVGAGSGVFSRMLVEEGFAERANVEGRVIDSRVLDIVYTIVYLIFLAEPACPRRLKR